MFLPVAASSYINGGANGRLESKVGEFDRSNADKSKSKEKRKRVHDWRWKNGCNMRKQKKRSG